MSEATLTKQKGQARTHEQTTTSASAEIDKVILGSVAAFTGVVALWSVACLMSAMFQAGGPLQLVGSYFKALAGM
ncbi:hypothetical protein UWK_02213 [Desulfocapsa sulfexigens DSM 10523]|uniref:Uncharacterized protein n=1 Tax=Desulfocapsa sulfexigens (strain DSM 10523 / SB164P1) TaxID=1167006 RepID=M1NGI0_DESSD|nr:hypothetical protein [Desulfocapsa sulfexigens]AGF78754.1 hypothetical protein UWK_02213 [Desulfocapsa sulfexigens DSM 10523]